MKVVEAPTDNPKLLELLDEAEHEPVLIQRSEKDAAVILSAEDYRRLRASEAESFHELCVKMSAYAQSRGLTEEKLAEILADEHA
jgi:prevent-host-death family protein